MNAIFVYALSLLIVIQLGLDGSTGSEAEKTTSLHVKIAAMPPNMKDSTLNRQSALSRSGLVSFEQPYVYLQDGRLWDVLSEKVVQGNKGWLLCKKPVVESMTTTSTTTITATATSLTLSVTTTTATTPTVTTTLAVTSTTTTVPVTTTSKTASVPVTTTSKTASTTTVTTLEIKEATTTTLSSGCPKVDWVAVDNLCLYTYVHRGHTVDIPLVCHHSLEEREITNSVRSCLLKILEIINPYLDTMILLPKQTLLNLHTNQTVTGNYGWIVCTQDNEKKVNHSETSSKKTVVAAAGLTIFVLTAILVSLLATYLWRQKQIRNKQPEMSSTINLDTMK